MRVVYNSIYADGVRAIQNAADSLTEAQRQLASGRRIEKPSDDPLGNSAAILEHNAMARLDAYTSAADAAGYRLSLADSALSDIISQLNAAQTATLSARGTSVTQAHRDSAHNEILAIRHALLGDINTKFQGTYIFSGADVATAPFEQTGSTFTGYQGDSTQTRIEIANGASARLSFDGGAIFQGADTQHILDALGDLATAVQAGDETGIQNGLAAISRAYDRATNAQASIGNELSRVDDARLRTLNDRTGVTARLQSIEDADMAAAAAKLAQADTAYKAAIQSLSMIGRVTLMDYL